MKTLIYTFAVLTLIVNISTNYFSKQIQKGEIMKSLVSILVLFTIAFFVSGCSDMNTDITSPEKLAKDKMIVPWKGNMEGIAITFGTPCGTDMIPKKLTAAGNSSHLGKGTADFRYCVMYTSTTGGIIINSGIHSILTAANGDELWMDFVSGSFQITEWIEPPYVCVVEATIDGVVVGGTGRFADATGNGVCSAVQMVDFRLPDVPTVIDWTGTISY